MQELGQRSSGTFTLNHLSSFFVSCQFAKDSGGHSLDIFNLVVEKLHKDWNDREAPDDVPVVSFPGQDVQGSNGAFHDLLHPDPVGVGPGRLTTPRSPLGVLECPDQQMDQSGNAAVLPEWGVVGRAQGQVADETNDGLDQRPTRWRMQESDNGGKTALEPDCVLGHLTFSVSGGQVTKSTHGWLSDLFSVSGCNDGLDEGFNASDLAHDNLVLLVVAGKIGKDASCTSDNVDIAGAKQLNQALHQILHVVLDKEQIINNELKAAPTPYNLGSSIGEIPQGPEAVLNQSLTRMSQVDGQELHATSIDDGWLVAGAH